MPNISVVLLPLFRSWIMIYPFQSCLLSWSLIFGWTWREFEWTSGVGDEQGGLVSCDSWGCKESDTTERLNWLTGHKNKIYKYAACDVLAMNMIRLVIIHVTAVRRIRPSCHLPHLKYTGNNTRLLNPTGSTVVYL